MRMKRFALAGTLAVLTTVVPISRRAEAPIGIGLSTASCAEGGCGQVSKWDCMCPDYQEKYREPRCFD